MIIDFHTHLDWYDKEEIKNQLEQFSGLIITASVDEKSYEKNKLIAESQKAGRSCHIIPSFGIHPNQADKYAPLLEDEEKAAALNKLMEESPLIGEIGMDFCWAKSSPKNQEKVFRHFLEHCDRKKKVCVIHTKDAEKEIASILAEYPEVKPVIHWYDGPEEIFREFLRRGYPQTFGVETIRSDHIQKLLKLAPPELILAETDNPTAEPWLGGDRSDIALIERVYDELAKILGTPRRILEKLIEDNVRRILQ